MVLENITEECHQYNLDHHQVGVNEPINTVLQTILCLAVNFVPWLPVKTRLNTRKGFSESCEVLDVSVLTSQHFSFRLWSTF